MGRKVIKIGLEAEYLLFNSKGEIIIPPATFDRDGFPLLGEIRGNPGESMPETVSNFHLARLKLIEQLKDGYSIAFKDIERVPLKLYQEAMKESRQIKGEEIGKVKNVYGIDISEFSDQILSKGKIQGINISCGLHIHFSIEDVSVVKYGINDGGYRAIKIPACGDIDLYIKTGNNETHDKEIRTSLLTKPVIESFVRTLDDKLFKAKYEPKNCTKYRQAGFFELKHYGFEYRSLPMNDIILKDLEGIVSLCFDVAKTFDTWD